MLERLDNFVRTVSNRLESLENQRQETEHVQSGPEGAEGWQPTPQEKVDQTVTQYEVAVNSGNPAAIETAKRDVYTAVREEIAPQLSRANANVPPQYRTPTDIQIANYGTAIVNRHQTNPVAQTVVQEAVGDYQLQQKADNLVPYFSGPFTPREKLDSLQLNLEGQPPEVVDRVMQNPAVQQMFKDAAASVAEPYNGVSGERVTSDAQAANEASQRLADLTTGLPPQWAQQITRDSLPTIQNIANVDAAYGGAAGFTNLSRVVGSLGEGPEAQALTQEIAQAYRTQYDIWGSRFADPNGSFIRTAVGEGASPELALELAAQLNAGGRADEAAVVVRTVERGIEDLQGKVEQDFQAYAEHTQELNWLIANSKTTLTPPQLQQAIHSYLSREDGQWQQQLRDIEGRLTADASALNDSIGALQNLPGDLQQTAPDAFQRLNENVGLNEGVKAALEFAQTRSPTIFAGDNGESALGFWLEQGNNSKDFTNSLAQAYLSSRVLPQIGSFNPRDAASVAAVNQVLDNLQAKGARLWGLPQVEVDSHIARLRGLVHTLQSNPPVSDAFRARYDLRDVQKQLMALDDATFSSGPAGLAFRTVALGISGAGFLNSTGELIDNPDVKPLLSQLAFSAGLAQDASAFAATVDLVNKQGAIGRFGFGVNLAGRFTGGFIGALNITSFVANGVIDLANPELSTGTKVASGVVNGSGALGVGLATFRQLLGLSPWAGPVGFGIAIAATGANELVKYRAEVDQNTQAAEAFLTGGGIDPGVAKTLSSDALTHATDLRNGLDLSPEQLQQIAERYPQLLTGAAPPVQAVVDVARANGLASNEVVGFIDALAKDNPGFVDPLVAQLNTRNPAAPLSYQARLQELIATQFPNAASYVREHSSELYGPDADARRQAAQAYESAFGRDPATIANLLTGDNRPAYQSEIIRILKDTGGLDPWVNDIATTYRYNGWPEAAKLAIESAEQAGVLTHDQAQQYLSQLG